MKEYLVREDAFIPGEVGVGDSYMKRMGACWEYLKRASKVY